MIYIIHFLFFFFLFVLLYNSLNPRELRLKAKYLLTSYVSTNAINPSGNAMAKETIAASSPSLDSSVDTLRIFDTAER